MRTTIANRFDESLTAIQTHARQVADEQNRLSTGTKLLRASDSPIAIGRAVDLRTSSAHLDSLKRLQGAATNRMAEAELAMQDAARVLDDFHQLWAATQNGSLGPDQLRLFSTQARALQEELRQTLTRTDAGGYRLFDSKSLLVMIGGGSNNVDPISVDTVGAISDLKVLNSTLDPDWLTSASSLDAAIDKITIDADSLIAKFVQSLQAGERPVVLNQEFKTASQTMVLQRIAVGANQARVERATERADDVQLATQTALSTEVDTDYASSSMEVQKAKALLEAAQTITAQIGSMNLFQKLG
jgi:flagellin-like hook-associated protein FlgL